MLRRVLTLLLCVLALSSVAPAGRATPVQPAFTLTDAGATQAYGPIGRDILIDLPVLGPVVDPQRQGQFQSKESCESTDGCSLVPFHFAPSRRGGHETSISLSWDNRHGDDFDLYLFAYEPVSGTWQRYATSAAGSAQIMPERIRDVVDLPPGDYYLGVANRAETTNTGFTLTGTVTYDV